MRIFPILLAILMLMLPEATNARWFEAKSRNFIAYSDGEQDALRRSVQLLEDYDQLLRMLTGTTAPPSPTPLRVYLLRSVDALRQVEPVPPGVLGFYRARVGGTAIFAVRGDRLGIDGDEVLRHEYAHHFAARYYPAFYPAWYNEGFAEYVMTARFSGERIEIGTVNPGRALSLLNGDWLAIERVLAVQPSRFTKEEAGQFYAESWLIVHYLFSSASRRDSLSRYFADLQRGTAEAEAFRAAFGIDHHRFEADLKQYMKGRLAYGSIARPPSANATITISSLPPAADHLLLPMAAMMLGIAERDREAAILAEIRAAAARYADDPFAQRVLARAEISSGDRVAGTVQIDRLLQRTPDDPELLYLRGLGNFYNGRKDAASRAEQFALARPWFARAVAADPSYYTAMYRLAQTAPSGDGMPSDETLIQLSTAQALAPLVGDIALDAAAAFLARRQFDSAERVLTPIATNPHNGNAERARSLLAQAHAATEQK